LELVKLKEGPVITAQLTDLGDLPVQGTSVEWELCCVGFSIKLDSPQGGHEKYALDEYINLFFNSSFKLNGDQAYQDIIYPRLLLEGVEPFSALS
jgi:hypothetical protein